jgi:hypothetical protein
MTQHDISLHAPDIGAGLREAILALDIETARDLAHVIGQLAESRSRERIARAWSNGWLLGDHAMELLIDLELIEPPEVSDG